MSVRPVPAALGNLLILVLLVSSIAPAEAQQISAESDQLFKEPLQPLAANREDNDLDSVIVADGKCDNPVNGALIGGLIGSSPLLIAILLAERDSRGERYIPLAQVGLWGGIAGFFIGLGVDSAKCRNGEPFESDSISSNQSVGVGPMRP